MPTRSERTALEFSKPDLDAVTGSCLCGAVRFSVRLPTLFCGHCHCSICRRSHGAAFGTWFGVANDQFSLEAAEAEIGAFRSSDSGTRFFCKHCGSPVFFRSNLHPERVEIPLAIMHGSIDREPEAHIHYDDRADWVVVCDDLPRLGGPSGLGPIGGGSGRAKGSHG